MSITSRIFLAFFLVAVGGFWLLLDKLAERVERQYLEASEESMVDTANMLAAMVEQQLGELGREWNLEPVREAFRSALRREFSARIYNLTKTSVGTDVYVTDASGIVVYDSRDGAAEGRDFSAYNDVLRTLRGDYGARSSRLDPNDDRTSVMHVAAPIYRNGKIAGVLTVMKPQASTFVFADEARAQIKWIGLLVLAAILIAAFLAVRWLSRPIKRLTDYVRAVGRGERVVPPKLGRSDVAALGGAFEDMRDALEGRRYAETYVQTLTHEMKSPVAGIRGAVELIAADPEMPVERRQRFLGNIESETRRLQNIIERLLSLSAIEGRKTLARRDPVDLRVLIDEVCGNLGSALAAKRLTLETVPGENAVVFGERFLLEMAVANLVQNAVEFSPAGGTIRIQWAEDFSEGMRQPLVELRVIDEGPGIPEYALERVFERFYSLQHPDTGKKSSGLGLCFVREAAELHGGTAELRNRVEKNGAVAILRLPVGEGIHRKGR